MGITWHNGPKKGVTEYEGRVLQWEWNYAVVWDGGQPKTTPTTDYAYPTQDGLGWTRTWYEGSGPAQYFRASVTVDATKEVIEAANEWSRVSEIIEQTCEKYQVAASIGPNKLVKVFKGRKAPLGIYKVASLRHSRFGMCANLTAPCGRLYSYVSTRNMKVVEPERFIEGQVACHNCRTVFENWKSGRLRWRGVPYCLSCEIELVANNKLEPPLPENHREWPESTSLLTPAAFRLPGEVAFIEAICENRGDKTDWLVYADWLGDSGEYERERAIRLMCGQENPKKIRYRSKDLKIKEVLSPDGYTRLFEVTGFPPFKGVDTIRARAIGNDYAWIESHDEVPKRLATMVKKRILRMLEEEEARRAKG